MREGKPACCFDVPCNVINEKQVKLKRKYALAKVSLMIISF